MRIVIHTTVLRAGRARAALLALDADTIERFEWVFLLTPSAAIPTDLAARFGEDALHVAEQGESINLLADELLAGSGVLTTTFSLGPALAQVLSSRGSQASVIGLHRLQVADAWGDFLRLVNALKHARVHGIAVAEILSVSLKAIGAAASAIPEIGGDSSAFLGHFAVVVADP